MCKDRKLRCCDGTLDIREPLSVNTDYLLKWPFFVYLSRAALIPFRLEELITFDVKTFQLGATLLTKNKCLSPKKRPNHFVSKSP